MKQFTSLLKDYLLLAAIMIAWAVLALITSSAHAACPITSTNGAPATANADYLAQLFIRLPQCPKNVLDLRESVLRDGLQLRTTLVANRGFHNPTQGSFSLFEMITGMSQSTQMMLDPGNFFFGHFTDAQDKQLIPAQNPTQGALMVELIGWDPAKKVFNFYELIGDGTQGRWFYRGDSHDIQRDVKLLHLQPNPAQPQFGHTLRCAGCHTEGGPILKELAAPHNDWWDPQHPLSTGGRQPDAVLANMLKTLVPAEQLAQAVKSGLMKLQSSEIQNTLPLREKLRPLFCPLEVNFESDLSPSETNSSLRVPSAFFVDPRLAQANISAPAVTYTQGMSALGMHFPETSLTDGDHAFLAPVKAYSDQLAIEALRRQGVINDEFIADILAVDFTNPLLSVARCGLLKLIPETASGNWPQQFANNLQQAITQTPATSGWKAVYQQALANLTDPKRTAAFHRTTAQTFLSQCTLHANSNIAGWVKLLAQRRNELRVNEISKNPRGQILEPGFRVIFPEPKKPILPGSFNLTEGCEIRKN